VLYMKKTGESTWLLIILPHDYLGKYCDHNMILKIQNIILEVFGLVVWTTRAS